MPERRGIPTGHYRFDSEVVDDECESGCDRGRLVIALLRRYEREGNMAVDRRVLLPVAGVKGV